MAPKSISRRRKKCKEKRLKVDYITTTHVPLCALGEVLKEKHLFAPIHHHVDIPQKSLEYRPTDKLVFATLGFIAGAETVSDINQTVRPNKPLLSAFGYDKCADQSVIQQTINAATDENVSQLQQSLSEIYQENNQTSLFLDADPKEQEIVTMDIDLSALPAAKGAQGSKKGYVPRRKNQYTRQLARVLVPKTQEIVTQSLYPGNTLSLSVFKEIVEQMETHLKLDAKAKRQQILLRLDAGFGTDKNINFALWRGYHILVKMYSGKRAKKLQKSVNQWVAVPSEADNTKREAGLVIQKHRYCRKTVQVAVRTEKKKGGYSYSVLVTTCLDMSLHDIVTLYDKRSGVPESTFCQDYQGLSVRKRRKGGFTAQQVLVLLSQLAHNLMVWMKNWLAAILNYRIELSIFLSCCNHFPRIFHAISHRFFPHNMASMSQCFQRNLGMCFRYRAIKDDIRRSFIQHRVEVCAD